MAGRGRPPSTTHSTVLARPTNKRTSWLASWTERGGSWRVTVRLDDCATVRLVLLAWQLRRPPSSVRVTNSLSRLTTRLSPTLHSALSRIG